MKTIEEELEGVIAILHKHLHPARGKITWSPTELEARNKLIYTLMLRGYSTISGVHFIMDTFGISYKQAYKWYREAKKDAIPDVEEYRDKCYQIAVERLTDIYNKAMDNGKLKDAIAAQTELNKINGLQTQRVDVSVDKPIEFTFS